jgi:CheY-like chemotaxis protein
MPVNADLIRLAQVFSNLLNNAAKYTKPGGHIWFTVTVVDKHVIVSVKDDGLGIEPHMLDKVFEMFTQIEPSLDRTQGGLGIGLSIARELVNMHDATIEASSNGAGLGSEFVIRLPLSTSPFEARRAADTSSDFGSQTFPCRVLVVDDNVDSAESLSLLLDMMGNETVMAHDGNAAVEAAKTFIPDIALLDIGLPGISGYEIASILRKLPQLQHTLLVALTGWGQEEDRRRCIDAGFDHHLTKPAAVDDLKNLLSNWGKSRLKTSA